MLLFAAAQVISVAGITTPRARIVDVPEPQQSAGQLTISSPLLHMPSPQIGGVGVGVNVGHAPQSPGQLWHVSLPLQEPLPQNPPPPQDPQSAAQLPHDSLPVQNPSPQLTDPGHALQLTPPQSSSLPTPPGHAPRPLLNIHEVGRQPSHVADVTHAPPVDTQLYLCKQSLGSSSAFKLGHVKLLTHTLSAVHPLVPHP